jgi:sulfatase modifying factor 1
VSFYDTLRFANWLNNGQGSGDTETGAYTLLGGTQTPSNGTTVTRNPGATIALPSDNEWYKAAYYDASSTDYFLHPTRSNAATACTGRGAE